MSPGKPSFGQIRAEYERHGFTSGLYERVGEVVHRVARRYPPAIYAETGGTASGNWTDEEIDNLTQAFVVDVLLNPSDLQIEAIMALASSDDEFDALLRKHVRRYLARQRRRGAVDNLVDDVRGILSEPPYVKHPGSIPTYGAEGAGATARRPSDNELLKAARLIATIPRLHEDPHERAPKVYGPRERRRIVEIIVASLPCRFALDDVREALNMVLTDLALSALLPVYGNAPGADEARSGNEPAQESGGGPMMAARSLATGDAVLASDAARRMLEELDPEQRTILLLKFNGVTDVDLASQLGVSRPTAIKRRDGTYAQLQNALGGLTPEVQEIALRVTVQLIHEEGP